MTIDALERFLKVKPFTRFILRESSGEVYVIVSPEMIRLMPKLNIVVIFTTDGDLVMLAADQVTTASYERPTAPKKKRHTP